MASFSTGDEIRQLLLHALTLMHSRHGRIDVPTIVDDIFPSIHSRIQRRVCNLSKLFWQHAYILHRYFASGTGAAGLVGAFMWWEVRSLGVRLGVGMSSVRSNMILCTPSLLIFRVPAHAVNNTVDLLFPAPKHICLLIPDDIRRLQRYAQSSSPDFFSSIHPACSGRR